MMGGSKRSLSALRHALQLFKACLNKWHHGWDKITVLHASCDLYPRQQSSWLYTGVDYSDNAVLPRPDAAATRVQSDLRPSLTGLPPLKLID